MKWYRVRAVLLQEWYLTLHSVEVIIDTIIYPLMNVAVFGFLSMYLSGVGNRATGEYVLAGMLLWQTLSIIQYTICLGPLWNIWSRNLSNLYITPLTTKELVVGHLISGILKAMFIFLSTSIISIYLFDFNIFTLGMLNLLLIFINIIVFGFSLGMIIVAFIYRFGIRIQAFAWGLIPIFQPIAAVFYPASILPSPFKEISLMLPPTYIFEAVRYSLTYHKIHWVYLSISFMGDLLMCVFAIFFFQYMFKKSKESGQFARNEG